MLSSLAKSRAARRLVVHATPPTHTPVLGHCDFVNHRREPNAASIVRLANRRQAVRIRYVEGERRKGGTIEQMIEVGRVSVHSHRKEGRQRERANTAGDPVHDPG